MPSATRKNFQLLFIVVSCLGAACARLPQVGNAGAGSRLFDSYDRNRCSITNEGNPIRPRVSIVTPVANLAGHQAFISKVVYHEQLGRPYLVSTSWDGTARKWDLSEMQEVWQRNISGEKLTTVALTKDGNFALVGGQSNLIRLVALESGVVSREYTLPAGVWANAIEFIPNGESFLVGGSDTNIHVIEFATGRETAVLRGLDWPITNIAYSPQRDFVLGSSSNAIGVWNLSTGQLISRHVDTGVSDGEGFWVETMEFSPRLDYIIAGSRKMIVIMDTVTGEIVQRFVGHIRPIQSLFITEDYCRIVSASQDSSVRIWDVKTGQEISALLQVAFKVPSSIARSGDGKKFFMGVTAIPTFAAEIQMLQFANE